jgi:large subunit ribosomal protein L24
MRILTFRKTAGERSRKRHAINVERDPIHVVKGDTVKVVRGDDKGKTGKVLRVFTKTGRITIEGVNIVKKHRKARRAEEQSQIMEMPAPVHASNVMLVDPKSGEATRVRIRVDSDGTKERISAKSGEAIARPAKS